MIHLTNSNLHFLAAHTFGLHNFMWGGQYNTSLDDDDSDICSLYAGGGFFNMSGYEPNSLIGPHYGSALLGYRYQVAKSGFCRVMSA